MNDTYIHEEDNYLDQLKNLKGPVNTSPTWDLTRLDAFKYAVEREFANFPWKAKIIWEVKNKIDLEITVSTADFGHISTNFPIKTIYDSDCPKNLPLQLRVLFEKQFLYKIKNLEKTIKQLKKKEKHEPSTALEPRKTE